MEYIINKDKIYLLEENREFIISSYYGKYSVRRKGYELIINDLMNLHEQSFYYKNDVDFETLECIKAEGTLSYNSFTKSYSFKQRHGGCYIKEDHVDYYQDTFRIQDNCLVNEAGNVIYDFLNDKTFVKYNGIREIKDGNYEEINRQTDALKEEMDKDVEPVRNEVIKLVESKLSYLPEEKREALISDLSSSLKKNLHDYYSIEVDIRNIKSAYRNLEYFVKAVDRVNNDIKFINSIVDAALFVQMNDLVPERPGEEDFLYVLDEKEARRQRSNPNWKNLFTFDDIEEDLEVMIPGFSNLSNGNVITNPLDSKPKTRSLINSNN